MAITIPDWPDPASAEGEIFFSNAQSLFGALSTAKKTPAYCCGLIANFEAESSLDPNAMGDHVNGEPTAFGMGQRHMARIIAIRDGDRGVKGLGFDIAALARAGKNTILNEVAATFWELDNFSFYGRAAIEAQTTAYMAAYQACALFERAGATNAAERRGKMAERWTVYFARKS